MCVAASSRNAVGACWRSSAPQKPQQNMLRNGFRQPLVRICVAFARGRPRGQGLSNGLRQKDLRARAR
eukprot:3367810-Alexandrium_andersonii.AAC.1